MPDWRAQAACKRADPRLFDPPEREPYSALATRYARAATFCHRCPVKLDCLTEALDTQDIGFRGGRLLVHEIPASLGGGKGCGTWNGYQRHWRSKETPCDRCREAARLHSQQSRSHVAVRHHGDHRWAYERGGAQAPPHDR